MESAVKALEEAGIKPQNIQLYPVAGSFEIPLIGRALAEQGKVDGLVALGLIIEGETEHASLIAQEAARGIMAVQVQFGTPFAFEVLYVRSRAQALARLDKGAEAASAVLHSLSSLSAIEASV